VPKEVKERKEHKGLRVTLVLKVLKEV
jgi:hypothetical protein